MRRATPFTPHPCVQRAAGHDRAFPGLDREGRPVTEVVAGAQVPTDARAARAVRVVGDATLQAEIDRLTVSRDALTKQVAQLKAECEELRQAAEEWRDEAVRLGSRHVL